VQPCCVVARGTRPRHQRPDDRIPVCRLHRKEGIRIANESVESGKVRSALIRQAWCGLRGGLKRAEGEDDAEALRPAHHDSIHITHFPSQQARISQDLSHG
jgi:hypothetical protein